MQARRQTDRQTGRYERQIWQRDRQTDGQTHRQGVRLADRQTSRRADIHTYIHTDRQTYRQTDRYTDRPIDRQTGAKTDILKLPFLLQTWVAIRFNKSTTRYVFLTLILILLFSEVIKTKTLEFFSKTLPILKADDTLPKVAKYEENHISYHPTLFNSKPNRWLSPCKNSQIWTLYVLIMSRVFCLCAIFCLYEVRHFVGVRLG